MVVVQWSATGTFTGAPFQGIRATGRRVTFRGCDVVEIRDGLVIDNTIYWDGAAFARAIGMLPQQGSLPDRLLLRGFNAMTRIRTVVLSRRPGRSRVPR
jgi:SnoaL-like polyketide cyclase